VRTGGVLRGEKSNPDLDEKKWEKGAKRSEENPTQGHRGVLKKHEGPIRHARSLPEWGRGGPQSRGGKAKKKCWE